ncbi:MULTISPECIES: hypothetical protein [unclassified Roseitalea]|uniref:hypothetical protein n=1 Tax=unclassified Roseitalea TaxID=2639107 RepID=UPI00273DB404|nr:MULTISPECIES: hypothetical protein [unclassified Roseitalea]
MRTAWYGTEQPCLSSKTVVTVDGGPPVSLINVVAASGALYTNGALSLHSKADDALATR